MSSAREDLIEELEDGTARLTERINELQTELADMKAARLRNIGAIEGLRELAMREESAAATRPDAGNAVRFDPHGAPPELGPPPNEKADA